MLFFRQISVPSLPSALSFSSEILPQFWDRIHFFQSFLNGHPVKGDVCLIKSDTGSGQYRLIIPIAASESKTDPLEDIAVNLAKTALPLYRFKASIDYTESQSGQILFGAIQLTWPDLNVEIRLLRDPWLNSISEEPGCTDVPTIDDCLKFSKSATPSDASQLLSLLRGLYDTNSRVAKQDIGPITAAIVQGICDECGSPRFPVKADPRPNHPKTSKKKKSKSDVPFRDIVSSASIQQAIQNAKNWVLSDYLNSASNATHQISTDTQSYDWIPGLQDVFKTQSAVSSFLSILKEITHSNSEMSDLLNQLDVAQDLAQKIMPNPTINIIRRVYAQCPDRFQSIQMAVLSSESEPSSLRKLWLSDLVNMTCESVATTVVEGWKKNGQVIIPEQSKVVLTQLFKILSNTTTLSPTSRWVLAASTGSDTKFIQVFREIPRDQTQFSSTTESLMVASYHVRQKLKNKSITTHEQLKREFGLAFQPKSDEEGIVVREIFSMGLSFGMTSRAVINSSFYDALNWAESSPLTPFSESVWTAVMAFSAGDLKEFTTDTSPILPTMFSSFAIKQIKACHTYLRSRLSVSDESHSKSHEWISIVSNAVGQLRHIPHGTDNSFIETVYQIGRGIVVQGKRHVGEPNVIERLVPVLNTLLEWTFNQMVHRNSPLSCSDLICVAYATIGAPDIAGYQTRFEERFPSPPTDIPSVLLTTLINLESHLNWNQFLIWHNKKETQNQLNTLGEYIIDTRAGRRQSKTLFFSFLPKGIWDLIICVGRSKGDFSEVFKKIKSINVSESEYLKRVIQSISLNDSKSTPS